LRSSPELHAEIARETKEAGDSGGGQTGAWLLHGKGEGSSRKGAFGCV